MLSHAQDRLGRRTALSARRQNPGSPLHSETIARNWIFETMLSTAKDRPKKRAIVSKISFIFSDNCASSRKQVYHEPHSA